MAMVLALAVLSLLVTTMTMMAVSTGLQIKRTKMVAEDAQLRQLLVAVTQSVDAQLNEGNASPGAPALPETLQQHGASLTLNPQPSSGSDSRAFEIEAWLPKRHISQRVVFTNQAGTWHLASAELGS